MPCFAPVSDDDNRVFRDPEEKPLACQQGMEVIRLVFATGGGAWHEPKKELTCGGNSRGWRGDVLVPWFVTQHARALEMVPRGVLSGARSCTEWGWGRRRTVPRRDSLRPLMHVGHSREWSTQGMVNQGRNWVGQEGGGTWWPGKFLGTEGSSPKPSPAVVHACLSLDPTQVHAGDAACACTCSHASLNAGMRSGQRHNPSALGKSCNRSWAFKNWATHMHAVAAALQPSHRGAPATSRHTVWVGANPYGAGHCSSMQGFLLIPWSGPCQVAR